MNVITASPDGSKKVQVIRLADFEKTSGQVGLLISISEHCADLFVNPTSIENGIDVPVAAQKSALSTFEAAQIQLRQILDEQDRWSTIENRSEQLADEMLEENIKLIQDQRERIADSKKPSYRFPPRVARMVNGNWIAWYGALEPGPGTPKGFGASPELAIANFDLNFAALNPEPKPAEQSPVPPPPPPPPPPPVARPKKTKRQR